MRRKKPTPLLKKIILQPTVRESYLLGKIMADEGKHKKKCECTVCEIVFLAASNMHYMSDPIRPAETKEGGE